MIGGKYVEGEKGEMWKEQGLSGGRREEAERRREVEEDKKKNGEWFVSCISKRDRRLSFERYVRCHGVVLEDERKKILMKKEEEEKEIKST